MSNPKANPDYNQTPSNFSIGSTAQDLVLKLPDLISKRIAKYTFRVYTPGIPASEIPAQQKFMDPHIYRHYAYSNTIDELLSTKDLDSVFRRLLFHDGNSEKKSYITVEVQQLTRSKLDDLLGQLSENEVLALCSRCWLEDGSIAHIPMIDFRCPPDDHNQAIVAAAIKSMGQYRGAILKSGRSFQYYGFDLIDKSDFNSFAAKCLLLTPIIDTRFIAHRILSEAFVLRISQSKQKPTLPYVVQIVDN